MSYFCNICKKTYSSNKSLWVHNKKYHATTIEQNVQNEINDSVNQEYKCNFCNKVFSKYQNRWRHQKTCKSNLANKIEQNNDITEKIIKMEKEIETLKQKPCQTIINNINKGTINKGPVYNFLNKIGDENIDVLSEKEIEFIMDQELNCIVSLITLLNFNQNIPENHTFCTTALNDKYISTINTNTLEIEKQRKKDFFDSLLWSGINKLKLLYNKLKLKPSAKIVTYKKNIDKLVDYVVVNNKGKKTFNELINALTFNNRHTVQSTWAQLKNNQIPEVTKQVEKPNQKNKQKLFEYNDSDSDSELTTDSESENTNTDPDDSDEENEVCEIVFKGVNYIIENNIAYNKTVDGQKGQVYGTYINNKLIKNKIKEIDV